MKSTRSVFITALALTLAACFAASDKEPAIKAAWITMPDGVRLAADLYMPAGARRSDRFPVLLEYLPYRKDESRARNFSLYSYFLDHGYVVARVDMRGTGNSDGTTIPYEYSDIELDDGEVVIDWLAHQEWSTGNVGMFGISWGGFNSIQMAMRNPPALKAFVALMATEYLYEEDVHYIDGIMHTDSWMMSNDLYNALPGAPDFTLDEAWLKNRFNVEPSVYAYMRQQRDGPFWDRASARGQYEKIKVPGY
ncbi:MAG: CocE/NonD family hydrolase, partial [Woeseiaceae bacterium]|nr:CocE/NonD family hydrolase [Woeseiaceae bacterium]